MRIAIANDVPLAVAAMRRVILAQGRDEVVWVARDGEEAVRRCAQVRPDLLLLDLVLPLLDGVAVTRRIMARTPCAIVIVTASVGDHTAQVFAAMGAGALDVVNTPALGVSPSLPAAVLPHPGKSAGGVGHVLGAPGGDGARGLLAKIETIRRLIAPSAGSRSPRTGGVEPRRGQAVPLVCLGASAGGPAALARVLAGLPGDFPAAVVMVQHVDAQFARGLAGWLGSHSRLPVRLAAEGEGLQAGVALLSGGEHHLVLSSAQRVGYLRAAAECAYRPSVDVFFQSVARHREPECRVGRGGGRAEDRGRKLAEGKKPSSLLPGPSWSGGLGGGGPQNLARRTRSGLTVGVLLTGMGRDGAEGLLAMRGRGFLTLAQDEVSSAVFGMPKAAAELQAATEILTLDKIAPRLVNEFRVVSSELRGP